MSVGMYIAQCTQGVRDQFSGIGLTLSTLFGFPFCLCGCTHMAGWLVPGSSRKFSCLLSPFGITDARSQVLWRSRRSTSGLCSEQHTKPSPQLASATPHSEIYSELQIVPITLVPCILCPFRIVMANTVIGGRPFSTIWRHILIFISE